MKAIIRGNTIDCPICRCNDFEMVQVKIQAIKRVWDEDSLYQINKDELECKHCGWTGYFENDYDPEKDYNDKRITYEN